MQTPTKITFVGFLLAASTLSVSTAKVNAETIDVGHPSNKIEYRLSRIISAIQEREFKTSNPLEDEKVIAGGFANRSGGGGFANRGGGGGFANRSGGGGFVNRSPFRNGGGFYNRY